MRKAVLALACVSIFMAMVTRRIIEFSLRPSCDVIERDIRRSPDGEHIASVFQRDCGATTRYVTGVALRRADRALVDDDANVALITEGVVPIVTRWIADDMLLIEAPAAARIFSRKSRWNEVRVELKSSM